MPSYSTFLKPPGPVATVRIIDPETGAGSQEFPGKLDTGADLTVIPEMLALQLTLPPWGHVRARGFDGSYARHPIYYVRLVVQGFLLPRVRCMSAQREDALLGRDVLNQFIITLDGKKLEFEIAET
jgi:predicted aspartyl protease